MKKLLALAAVAALTAAASPALAASAHQTHARNANALWQDFFAQAPSLDPNLAISPNAVYVDGQYAGADPDPRVRLQIRRDYNSQNEGG